MPSTINDGVFKAIVTGSPVTGRRVGEIDIDVLPIAGHAFAGNRLPNLGKIDEGMRRRLAIIEFHRRFDPGSPEMIVGLGRLVPLKEPDALLAWVVEGARSLVANGLLYSLPASSAALLEDMVVLGDPIQAFIAANVSQHEDGVLTKESALARWREWAPVHDEVAWRKYSTQAFWKEIQEILGKSRQVGSGAAQKRGIPGHALRKSGQS